MARSCDCPHLPNVEALGHVIASMETLWQDLRYTARTLLKNPGFTALAVLVLALGIGANTGIFSVVNSILLKPLPYRNPDRLVVALHSGQFPVSPADYLDYKQQVGAFEQLAAAQAWGSALSGTDKTEVLSGLQVTANLMPMLGVAPKLGRWFTADDEQAGARSAILLSDGLWQRRFGADPPNAVDLARNSRVCAANRLRECLESDVDEGPCSKEGDGVAPGGGSEPIPADPATAHGEHFPGRPGRRGRLPAGALGPGSA